MDGGSGLPASVGQDVELPMLGAAADADVLPVVHDDAAGEGSLPEVHPADLLRLVAPVKDWGGREVGGAGKGRRRGRGVGRRNHILLCAAKY